MLTRCVPHHYSVSRGTKKSIYIKKYIYYIYIVYIYYIYYIYCNILIFNRIKFL